MIAVFGLSGATSLALLATVSAARIADIALTDGTTRTSINAIYQVIPERARLSVQAAVEGIGVPVAIGVSGVLIIVLNALPFALAATIAVTTIVCAAWTSVSLLLYRAYGPALGHALRRRPLLVPSTDWMGHGESLARRLLSSATRARCGSGSTSWRRCRRRRSAERSGLVDDPRPDVRMSALAGLAAAGDEIRQAARERGTASIGSTDPAVRLRAPGHGGADAGERAAAAALLHDDDVAVRSAALESVQAGDLFAVEPAIAGLADGASSGPLQRGRSTRRRHRAVDGRAARCGEPPAIPGGAPRRRGHDHPGP